jgi:hypothetical protein
MDSKQDAFALTNAEALLDPHGWTTIVTTTAPLVAMCTVIIVLALCVTIIVLVRSTEPQQRVAAIKALAPALIALVSWLTSWLSAWRNS